MRSSAGDRIPTVRLTITGEMGNILYPIMTLTQDIQGVLYQVDPSMKIVFVKIY